MFDKMLKRKAIYSSIRHRTLWIEQISTFLILTYCDLVIILLLVKWIIDYDFIKAVILLGMLTSVFSLDTQVMS